MNFLELLQKVAKGELPESPAADLIGFKVVEAEDAKVIIELNVTEKLHNPMGILHGGIIGDIADAAMGYAFATTLKKNELFSTVEIKTNFLKPVFSGTLRAEGKLLKKGQSIGLLTCNIYDEKDELVAYSTSTCMVLKGQSNQKRVRVE
jgi:uncharacterized protein (TIGR00369 family)